MSNSPLPSLRKEVQDYFRSCEHLLSAAIASNHPPFSQEELDMVEFYAIEVAKMHAALAKK